MTRSRHLWILPDREQSGDLDVIEAGERRRLTDAVTVDALPLFFTLGIPESVLEAHPEPSLIYAQFARVAEPLSELLGTCQIFALSVRSGKDRDGRTVYLTGMQFLPTGEAPVLLPDDPLPDSEHATLTQLRARFNAAYPDRWVASVTAMLVAVQEHPELTSFANVDAPKLANRADWFPGRSKKNSFVAATVCIAIFLALLLLLRMTC